MAQPHVVQVVPDSALITAWREGDERAAAELVRRHARALARFLAGAGAPESDVDDLVQDTFIRAFRGVDRFRGQCQFRTWLMTIGGNVLKDFGRRMKRRAGIPLDETVRDVTGDPHERAGASEAGARLAAGLQALPRLQPAEVLFGAPQGIQDQDNAAASAARPGAGGGGY